MIPFGLAIGVLIGAPKAVDEKKKDKKKEKKSSSTAKDFKLIASSREG